MRETTEQEPSVTEEAEASLETKVVIDAFEETVVVLVAREHSIGEAEADIDELIRKKTLQHYQKKKQGYNLKQ